MRNGDKGDWVARSRAGVTSQRMSLMEGSTGRLEVGRGGRGAEEGRRGTEAGKARLYFYTSI